MILRKTAVFLFLIFSWQNLTAQNDFEWAAKIGGTGVDVTFYSDIDAAGNIYTTGFYSGTVDFDPGPGVFNLTSNGSEDGYVIKQSPSGSMIWAKSFGGWSSDDPNGITIDENGNSIVVGSFNGSGDYDPGSGVSTLTSAGNNDIFILKLDVDGNFVWVKRVGSTGGDFGKVVDSDNSGNIFLTGAFRETVDFDPGSGVFNLSPSSSGQFDIFVLKLNSAGEFGWAKNFGGSDTDEGKAIKADNSGNVFVTGDFGLTADFDPGPGTFNLTSAGGSDIFILKLNTSGDVVWVKQIGSTGIYDAGDALDIDISGNLYVTGGFELTCDFDPGAGVNNLTSAGLTDIFILKLNPAGDFVWAQKMGGTGYDGGSDLFLDAVENIFMTGSFEATADLDPGTAVLNFISSGDYDAFITKLNSTGNLVWSKKIGGTGGDDGRCVIVNAGGDIYVSGGFMGTVDFNPGTGTFNLTSSGSYEGYIMKLETDCIPTSHTFSASACTSYTLNSQTYTTNGTYTQTIPNAAGCDSTITLNLTIEDVTPPAPSISSLPNVTAQCSVTSLTAPTATDNCAGTITGTHNASLPISTQGMTVVTWIYNDGHGNTATQTQNVVITDNVAPVADAANLPNVTGTCSVISLTAPTATDNCTGSITGTHNASLPITTQGTTVVTWTYNDGHGNTSTQTQNVVITDDAAPVPNLANLPVINGNCSVTSITAPTATDNCAGTITGTTNTTFPITTPGNTTITWTFSDGHGNTSTQTQIVTVAFPVAATTLSGLTITATASGASYQWINCGTGNTPIAGATSQSFTAIANGTYAVIVTQNGCSSTSTCVTIATVGLEEITENAFLIYPNPNSGHFTIRSKEFLKIIITGAEGKLVLSRELSPGENIIQLNDVESGVYFINASTNDGKISAGKINIIR